jgi:hypothetical protein
VCASGEKSMSKQSWVYTSDGRKFEKGSVEHLEYIGAYNDNSPMVFGDNESFVSPIDSKFYSGKAQAREHNLKHSVVNHRDLVGLPVGFDPKRAAVQTTRQREERRQAIYDAAMRGKYLEGQ